MAEITDIQRDLELLAANLKRLEAEYNMYFSGRTSRPPWETRGRIETLIKRYDRGFAMNTGDRFQFGMLQSRFQSLVDLWDRGVRSREEGRPGPFRQPPAKMVPKRPVQPPAAKVVNVTAFTDPTREMDKVHALYDSLMNARRQHGEAVVPFHKFATLVKNQVSKLREGGNPEVAFRVAVKDGKVAFTVRAMKDAKGTKDSKE